MKFSSADEFAKYSAGKGILYYHVYELMPDRELTGFLSSIMDDDYEYLVELKKSDNEGFLSQLQVRCETPYLGAFTKGAFVDDANAPERIRDLVQDARRFYSM